jgi:formate hydrogenlyase subunit 4
MQYILVITLALLLDAVARVVKARAQITKKP